MKFWFHSAPLWKMDKFKKWKMDKFKKQEKEIKIKKEIRQERNGIRIRPIPSMLAFLSECIQNNSLSR